MKYFEFNVGDYQGKTAHLTFTEHGAYVLMLLLFYSSEKPIPSDRRVLYRLLRAESPAERKAIDAVAREFWSETDGKLSNKRCEETLATYLAWVAKQKANGSKGGRPPITHGEPNGNPPLKPKETNGKANAGYRARGITSDLDNHSDTHTHSDSDKPRAPHSGSAPDRVGGNFEKVGSGWKPPTDEDWYAGK